MVLPERLIAATLASKYVLNSRIDGDFVECGVWQGVLLIDDYGYWDGARKAIEHFFRIPTINALLFKSPTKQGVQQ